MTYGENEISPPTPPYAECYRGPDDRSAGAAVGVPGKKKIIFKLDATAATDAYDACLHRPWAPGSPEEEKNFRPGRGAALRGRPPGYRATRGENQISPSACRARRGTGEPTTAPPGRRKKKKIIFHPESARSTDANDACRDPRWASGAQVEKKNFSARPGDDGTALAGRGSRGKLRRGRRLTVPAADPAPANPTPGGP